MKHYDVAVIGGGPAGLGAAIEAKQKGAKSVVIIERDFELGGILNQCIHAGFGLHYFKEELTGPEYAQRFIDILGDVDVMLNTMVLTISHDRCIHTVSEESGYLIVEAGAIVLAMGCRERSRGAVGICGTRPSGIFTAGTAQRYVNMDGLMVGKKVVILGSGDIGLIMARRMALEGAQVLACIELMPFSAGLRRNIVQCLDDFDIPLYLSSTITEIKGEKRLTSVVVSKVDENKKPIAEGSFELECDTLLLSVGLIPENELSKDAGVALDGKTKGPIVYENMETTVQGIFACGNVCHVHDLVDFVSAEAKVAGAGAAKYITTIPFTENHINTFAKKGISYVLPQRVRLNNVGDFLELFFRVDNVYNAIAIGVYQQGNKVASFKREFAVPGEMEKIRIPKKLLLEADIELIVENTQK